MANASVQDWLEATTPRTDNILNYINDLIALGYREDDAERMANVMFSDDFSDSEGNEADGGEYDYD